MTLWGAEGYYCRAEWGIAVFRIFLVAETGGALADGVREGEERYPDPHGLYRRWLGALGVAPDGGPDGTVGRGEIEELWRRWFAATTGASGGLGLSGRMAGLWDEMAADARDKMLSEGDLPENPVEFMVRWYEATNERWSQKAERLLEQDGVLESGRRLVEAHALSEREIGRVSEEGLRRLRIPTRSDVARVAELVVGVENKVDALEDSLDDLVRGASGPSGGRAPDHLADLEERVGRLEGKVDRILGALEEVSAAVRGTAGGPPGGSSDGGG